MILKDTKVKKLAISVICAAGLLTTATTANAAKFGFGVDRGFGVAAQFNNINAFLGNDGISGDYIFKQGSFDKDIPFNWYVGGGAFIDWDSDKFGVRLPLGITFPFAPRWDLYGQVSPDLSYRDKHSEFEFGVSAALGVRYAF
jgi:hypothetical protein